MPHSPRSPSPVLLPIIALLLAMVSLQLGAALAKTLFVSIGAQGATSLRLLFSALALLCFFRPWRMRLAPGAWRIITLYGLALGGMNFLFYMAIRTVPLGVAVALEFTGPLVVAVLSARRLAHFLWIGLACAGLLALVPWNAAAAQALDPAGVLYALGAAVCWALYIVFGQRAGTSHGPRTVALAVSIAAIAVFPAGLIHAGSLLFTPAILPLGFAVAILSSAIPYGLEMYVLTRLPARTFGTLLSLEPAFAAVFGMLLLGETLSYAQWAAIGAIVAASAGITASGRKARRKPPPAASQPTN